LIISQNSLIISHYQGTFEWVSNNVWAEHTMEDIANRVSLTMLWPLWFAELLACACSTKPDNYRKTDAITATNFLKRFYDAEDCGVGTFDPTKPPEKLHEKCVTISDFHQQVGPLVTHPANQATQLVKTYEYAPCLSPPLPHLSR
jgi:hypothetical protein